jgi:hypothetical protein
LYYISWFRLTFKHLEVRYIFLYCCNGLLFDTFSNWLVACIVLFYVPCLCHELKIPPPPTGTTQPIVGVYFTAFYWALASSRTRLLDHIQRRVTVGRTPLNEWSVHCRDLYLTTHNIHALGGIRTHDRSRRVAVDLRFRPRTYWDQQLKI